MTPPRPLRRRPRRSLRGGAPPAFPPGGRPPPKGRLAWEMLDELAGWGLRPPVVAADAGYGNNGDFRAGITARGSHYVAAVDGDLTAHAQGVVPTLKPYSGRGRRPRPRYRTRPMGLREHALAAGHHAARQVTWREGSRGPMTSRFLALRVRRAGRKPTARLGADGSLPDAWLLAEWPPEATEPTGYWLAGLPPGPPLPELVGLAKIRWRIEHDYRECKTGLGLDHFEGSTFTGWHRHVTLVTAAQLFLTLLRTDPKRLRRPEPVCGSARPAGPARDLDRHLHRLRLPHRHLPASADLTKYY